MGSEGELMDADTLASLIDIATDLPHLKKLIEMRRQLERAEQAVWKGTLEKIDKELEHGTDYTE